jgi:predicted aspartyl protease
MAAYDSALFTPPAPLARIVLLHPETGATVENVPMLLDTGADATLIPRAIALQIGATPEPDRTYQLEGFDGSISSFEVVQVHMAFLRRTFRGRFLLIDQEWGLIGRDILNHVSIRFDGPQLIWTEHR